MDDCIAIGTWVRALDEPLEGRVTSTYTHRGVRYVVIAHTWEVRAARVEALP